MVEVGLPSIELDGFDRRQDLIDEGNATATDVDDVLLQLLHVHRSEGGIRDSHDEDHTKCCASSKISDEEVQKNHHH